MSPDQVSRSAIETLALGRLREALRGERAYLVGGVTRTMFGAEPLADDDIDVAVEGDIEPLLDRLVELGFDLRRHDRFGTATVSLDDGVSVDLARARAEWYERPGELPDVSPASIEQDLARRDFTINAIAVALDEPHHVLDPFGGRRDLREGILRVLHERSFEDDPTRAIRGARYASRLGLVLDPKTERLIRETDLETVSADRRRAELRRLAAERRPSAGIGLLADWGLIELPAGALELIDAVCDEWEQPPWRTLGESVRIDAVMLAAGWGDVDDRGRALELASESPASPSEGERLIGRLPDPVLLLAAAAGGKWVREHVERWRELRLAISGDDLIEAGIPAGPGIGLALAEVRRMVLDGELPEDRDDQLRAALDAAARSRPSR